MNLDNLLSQPLSPVCDDGFSARIVLELRRREERRRWLLWGAVAAGLLPLAAALPMALLPLDYNAAAQAIARAVSSPILASAAGALVLAWALRPMRTRF